MWYNLLKLCTWDVLSVTSHGQMMQFKSIHSFQLTCWYSALSACYLGGGEGSKATYQTTKPDRKGWVGQRWDAGCPKCLGFHGNVLAFRGGGWDKFRILQDTGWSQQPPKHSSPEAVKMKSVCGGIRPLAHAPRSWVQDRCCP